MLSQMRIAILHNYMDNIGGAQIALLTLARELKADVYSTVVDTKAIEMMGFQVLIKSIGWVPINAPWRQQIAAARMRRLSLQSKYDFFIIAGDWALAAAVRNKPNIWYCHSPSRELWDLYDDIRAQTLWLHTTKLYDWWVWYNRYLNHKYAAHVNKIICSSKNAQQRVKQYLHLDSELVYPPIDIKDFYNKPAGDYWLSVNRLVSYKRVELQLEAFRRLPQEKLIIVGAYEDARHFQSYATRIQDNLPKNVTLLPAVSRKKLLALYAGCRGFITTSQNEDFGLTVIEAMAAGKPVVATAEGGYLETVINGKTGYLVAANIDAIVSGIQKVLQSGSSWRSSCQEQAAKFSTEKHVVKMIEHIKRVATAHATLSRSMTK